MKNTTITRVESTNLKGRNIKQALAPLTLIQGPNGHGKTAHLDAIVLAATGFHPARPRTNPGVFDFASGSPLSVGIWLSDGTSYARTWSQTAKGIQGGRDLQGGTLDALTFVPSGFFTSNEREQAAMILQRTGGDHAALIKRLREAMSAHPIAAKYAPKEGDYSEFSRLWLEGLSDAHREAKAYTKRMESTVQGLATLDAMAATGGEAPTLDSVIELEQAVAKLEATNGQNASNRRAAFGELRSCELTVDAWDAYPWLTPQEAATALLEAERALQAGEGAFQALKGSWSAYNRAAALRTQLESMARPDIEAARARLALAEAVDSRPVAVGEYAPATFGALQRELLDELDALQRKASATLPLTGLDTCPCCGAVRGAWDEAKSMEVADAARLAVQAAEVKERVKARLERLLADRKTGEENANHNAQRERAIQAARSALGQVEEAMERYARRESELAQLPPRPEQTEQEYAQGLESLEEAEAAASEAHKRAQNYHDVLRRIERAGGYAEGSVTKDTAAARITAAIQAGTAAGEAEATAIIDARTAAATARREYNSAEAARADAARATQSREEAEKAKREEVEIGSAREFLQDHSATIAGEAMKPVVEAALYFTDGLLPTPLSSQGLALGRWDGPTWIPLATFSESERMIAMAGIIAGLSAGSELRVCFIDELNRIDAVRRGQFLERIASAIINGRLTQAVMCCNVAFETATDYLQELEEAGQLAIVSV